MRTKRWGVQGRAAVLFCLSFILLSGVPSATLAEETAAVMEYNGPGWISGDNCISILPPERKANLQGVIQPPVVPLPLSMAPMDLEPYPELPPGLDWRNYKGKNYVTPIRDQDGCGSCWAFSTTAALESYYLIYSDAPGQNLDLAEQIMLSCPKPTAGTCKGGWPPTAADYIRDTGLPPESFFPYAAQDLLCEEAEPGWKNYTYKIFGWDYVLKDVDSIKRALYTYGPLPTIFKVFSDFYSYNGGLYYYRSGNYQGLHAVLIVGYQDATDVPGGGFFIVKNSWGTCWGEKGFFRITYSELDSLVLFGSTTMAYHRPVWSRLKVQFQYVSVGSNTYLRKGEMKVLEGHDLGDLNFNILSLSEEHNPVSINSMPPHQNFVIDSKLFEITGLDPSYGISAQRGDFLLTVADLPSKKVVSGNFYFDKGPFTGRGKFTGNLWRQSQPFFGAPTTHVDGELVVLVWMPVDYTP